MGQTKSAPPNFKLRKIDATLQTGDDGAKIGTATATTKILVDSTPKILVDSSPTKLEELPIADYAPTAPLYPEIVPEIKDTPQAIESLERIQQFFALRKAGASYEQIARRFNVDAAYVQAEVKRILDQYQTTMREDIKDLRTMENMRLDSALLAVWPDVVAGDVTAVLTMIKIMERRAKLLGLDSGAEGALPDFITQPTDEDSAALKAIANDGHALAQLRSVLTRIGIAQKAPGV